MKAGSTAAIRRTFARQHLPAASAPLGTRRAVLAHGRRMADLPGAMGASRKGEPVTLVLDTSVFTNPDTAAQFGANASAALGAFVAAVRTVHDRVRCVMPPSIFDELKTFVPPEQIPDDFEYVVSLRAPERYRILVPGFLLYELIEDIRGRIDRGLRVAEKAVRSAGPKNIDAIITRLREEYREALRAGLLDSREDVDLILLARELDAALVSSDRGVRTWAEKLGIRLIDPGNLRRVIESLREPDVRSRARR